MRLTVIAMGLGLTSRLHAATAEEIEAAEQTMLIRQQIQFDVGLSVIGVGFEHPLGDHVAVQAEAFAIGTYFLPWFNAGDRINGFGGGLRATWFADDDGRGFYVTPYGRIASAKGEHVGVEGSGVVMTAGVFAGYAFPLTPRLDLRLGAGVQYIYIDGDNGLRARAPFVAIDAVVGFRL